jgi:hypothetical protein
MKLILLELQVSFEENVAFVGLYYKIAHPLVVVCFIFNEQLCWRHFEDWGWMELELFCYHISVDLYLQCFSSTIKQHS